MVLAGDIIEIILHVQDMTAMVSFYRDKLGLQVRSPHGVSDFRNVPWVEMETGVCTLALHGGGQCRLGKDTPRFVFRVSDIQAAHDELQRRDVNMGPVRPAAPGVWVCDGTDPEGNRFSLESRP
jgi:predicted enzyme related to lactoylglutathione lyase